MPVKRTRRPIKVFRTIGLVATISFTFGVVSAIAGTTQEATMDGESTAVVEQVGQPNPTPSNIVEQDVDLCGLEVIECEHERPEYIEKLIVDAALKYRVSPRIMLNIAHCESRFNPKAVGDTDIGLPHPSYGLFQINPTWHAKTISKEDSLDPAKAADWAAKKVSEGGIGLWSCAKKLGYVQ